MKHSEKLALGILLVMGTLLVSAYFMGVAFHFDPQGSTSLPWRYFLRLPYRFPFQSEIKPGDYILFKTDRRMLPYYAPGKLFGKRVVGIPGDRLEVRGRDFYLNGRFLTRARETDSLGNPAPLFDYNGTIPRDCYFVLGLSPNSFDSRYWGFVCRDSVLGRLIPLGSRKRLGKDRTLPPETVESN